MRIDFAGFVCIGKATHVASMHRFPLIFAIALASAATHATAQNLITNGDFESGGIAGSASGTLAYWASGTFAPIYPTGSWRSGQYNGGADVAWNIVDDSGNNIAVQNNANTAGGAGADGFAQIIDISALTAGDAGTYELSFGYRANTTGFSYAIWSTTAPSSGSRFAAFNKQSAPTWPNPKDFLTSTAISATGDDIFRTESNTFTLSTTDIATYDYLTLSFASGGTGNTGLAFDNVSVALVPEPSTAALIAGAGFLLALQRRRRRH